MGTKFNIVVVGCGGIGGNYIKELGRYLYENPARQRCRILLVDGDLVEKDNVSRQPFLPGDVGRKKAEVMSEILQEAFGVHSEFYTEYIETVQELKAFELDEYLTVLIGAVDNHHCRKIMHKFFCQADSCYYLDGANEYSAGEVVAGMRLAGAELFHDRAHYFPEILEDGSRPKSQESCLKVNVREPQHLVTNLFAANLLLMNTVCIIKDEEWSGGIYLFDAFKGFSRLRDAEGGKSYGA